MLLDASPGKFGKLRAIFETHGGHIYSILKHSDQGIEYLHGDEQVAYRRRVFAVWGRGLDELVQDWQAVWL